jgi:hypothetical protein
MLNISKIIRMDGFDNLCGIKHSLQFLEEIIMARKGEAVFQRGRE